MTQALIPIAITTLLLFLVLTARACRYVFTSAHGRRRRSNYLILLTKAKRLYLYSWWIAAAGVAGSASLLILRPQGLPEATLEAVVLGLFATTSLVTLSAVIRGEILLTRADLLRDSRASEVGRSISAHSIPTR
jgi:hypothetical protein